MAEHSQVVIGRIQDNRFPPMPGGTGKESGGTDLLIDMNTEKKIWRKPDQCVGIEKGTETGSRGLSGLIGKCIKVYVSKHPLPQTNQCSMHIFSRHGYSAVRERSTYRSRSPMHWKHDLFQSLDQSPESNKEDVQPKLE